MQLRVPLQFRDRTISMQLSQYRCSGLSRQYRCSASRPVLAQGHAFSLRSPCHRSPCLALQHQQPLDARKRLLCIAQAAAAEPSTVKLVTQAGLAKHLMTCNFATSMPHCYTSLCRGCTWI